MESINFGTVPVTVAALIYIARDKGFFTANRLNVNIRDYATGTATTEALLKGAMDVSWVAEFPFVGRALEKEQLSIIAVVGRFNEQNLFGRKGRGIKAVADLKGKRIGIPRNTIAEFYLGRFLELNGMNIQDVSLVNVPPPQALDAITGDSIDGVIAWEPYSSQMTMSTLRQSGLKTSSFSPLTLRKFNIVQENAQKMGRLIVFLSCNPLKASICTCGGPAESLPLVIVVSPREKSVLQMDA